MEQANKADELKQNLHHEAISKLEDQLNDQKLELKEFERAKARVQELEEAHSLINSSKSDEVQQLNSKIIERDEQIKQLDLEFNHSKYNLQKSEAQNEDL